MSLDLGPSQIVFSELDPQAVLQALSLAGLPADGRLLQLNSYENRVWQAHLDDGRVVVAKFYRPGRWTNAQIAEEHAYTAELAQAELPVVSPMALTPAAQVAGDTATCHLAEGSTTLAHIRTESGAVYRLAVCERRAGRAPDLEQPEALAWLGRLMGRLHAVGRRGRFQHRQPLNAATFGHAARERLLQSGVVAPHSHAGWLRACDQALALVEQAFERHGPVASLRLHGDCHPGNVLWRDQGAQAGPNFVDFDDCCMGPAVQDLWMLLPGERSEVEAAQYHLLDGYRDFCDFDDRELLLIEPLRTLRMIHHSAWLAERWSDPAFPIGFPWFASPAYWNQQALELQTQVERMQDVADQRSY